MTSDDVLSITELGEKVKSGSVSPVALAESCLARIEKFDGQLNTFVTVMKESALKQARQAEQEIKQGRYRGPLHGIPYAVKDAFAVPGAPTTWGAVPFAQQTFKETAAVVKKLNDKGAILLGKTAMIEMMGGMGYVSASSSINGPTKNPWNTKRWAGGSSGGSAAAVAAGMAAFTIGTEVWGSILLPSSFTGVCGLRGTFGSIDMHGCMPLTVSLDKIGCLARSARDCQILFDAICADSWVDKNPVAMKKLKIGYVENAWQDCDTDIKKSVKAALKTFSDAGVEKITTKMPEGSWDAVTLLTLMAEVASVYERQIDDETFLKLKDPSGQVSGFAYQEVKASDYVRAQRIRSKLRTHMDHLLKDVDVLVAATLPITAPKLDQNIKTTFSFPDPVGAIGNLCGLPGISIPCGFDGNRLPIGIQIVGRRKSEKVVTAVAGLFQERSDWHKMRPTL